MNRNTVIGLVVLSAAGLLGSAAAVAQTSAAAPTKATATQPKAKAEPKKKATTTASRKAIQSQAAGLALATEVTETISDNQLQIANRVLTGSAQCEFNQTVSVDPIQDKPGHFRVGYKKAVYTMTPQETSTGAVRLEDKKNGIVWLQIPHKSMMMNQKIGQRMVDGCTQAEQRAAVAAVQAAGDVK